MSLTLTRTPKQLKTDINALPMNRAKHYYTTTEQQRYRSLINDLIELYYFSTGLSYGVYYHALPNSGTLCNPKGELRESDSTQQVKSLFKGNYSELIIYLLGYLKAKGITL